MTEYEVKSEEGADINGSHYDKGHSFEFDVLPDHFSDVVASGAVGQKKSPDQPEPEPQGDQQGEGQPSQESQDAPADESQGVAKSADEALG